MNQLADVVDERVRNDDDDCVLQGPWPQRRTHLQGSWLPPYRAGQPALRRHFEIIARAFRLPSGRWPQRRKDRAAVLFGGMGGTTRMETRLLEQCEKLRRQVGAGQAQLRQADIRLRELSAQLIEVQEQERKRIAAQLHDGIGQTLSVIRFGLEDARRGLGDDSAGDAGQLLDLLSGKMKGAIDEVRQMTMDLRPAILDDLGILPTINWFVREFRAAYPGIAVDLEIGVREADIPERLRTAIFRILQDAMHSIARQDARAAIRVRLSRFGCTLELAVEDSGPARAAGRRSGDAGTGHSPGPISLRDRASSSGGDYQVLSWAGHGGLIRVRWPLA
ncbi:MAG TPA: histidine kinase [Azonexus sp.]